MSGKGDKRRPSQVDKETFEQNWRRIFEHCPGVVEDHRKYEKCSNDTCEHRHSSRKKPS